MLAPTVLTFPMTELRTDRLLLRSTGEQDIEPTVRMYADAQSKRWLAGPQPYTLEEARRWCTDTAHLLRAMGDGVHWAIADLTDPKRTFLGGIGIKGTDWQARTTEIGYALTAEARGHGYAPEATRAVAEWVLREHRFNRVELFAATANTASQRTAEKAGFVREGVARNAGFTHQGQQDMVMFSLIPADLDL